MYIQAEISYSPFHAGFEEEITIFLKRLKNYKNLRIEIQPMSTLIGGEAADVFNLLEREVLKTFEENQAVFTIRISNACPDKCDINPAAGNQ
ncbi:MAG: hypothetical protein ACOC31_05870 [Bacteroidota bacterium]